MSNKRVKCKFAKQCQHFAKKVSPKQKEKSALCRAKEKKAFQLRKKKTNCPPLFLVKLATSEVFTTVVECAGSKVLWYTI